MESDEQGQNEQEQGEQEPHEQGLHERTTPEIPGDPWLMVKGRWITLLRRRLVQMKPWQLGVGGGAIAVVLIVGVALLFRGRSHRPETSADAPQAESATTSPPATPEPPAAPPPQAAQAELEPAPALAAPSHPQTDLKLLKRGRARIAKVKAPTNGTVSWTAAADAHVRKGEELGVVTAKAGAKKLPLKAARDGILVRHAGDGAAVRRGVLLGDVVSAKAVLTGMVVGARPTATWSCEVADPASGQRADCAITKVVPKGKRTLVMATTEPLWFDAAKTPTLRIAPP